MPVGSSASKMAGRLIRLLAMAARCCCLLTVLREMFQPVSKPKSCDDLVKPFQVRSASVQKDRQQYVFLDGECGDQIIKLIDKTNLPPSEGSKRLFIQSGYIGVLNTDLALGGPVHTSQKMQKRGFTGTGGADNGCEFSAFHGESDMIQAVTAFGPVP